MKSNSKQLPTKVMILVPKKSLSEDKSKDTETLRKVKWIIISPTKDLLINKDF